MQLALAGGDDDTRSHTPVTSMTPVTPVTPSHTKPVTPQHVQLTLARGNDDKAAIVGDGHVLDAVRPLPAVQLVACAGTRDGDMGVLHWGFASL